MNPKQFLSRLHEEGFPEPVEVRREPLGSLGEHTHPFAVKALVTEGSIDLLINGVHKQYLPGDIFHLGLKESHAESYGPLGVCYLASRKE